MEMKKEITNVPNHPNSGSNSKGLSSGGPLATMSTTTPASSAVSVQIKPRTVPPPPLPPPPPPLPAVPATPGMKKPVPPAPAPQIMNTNTSSSATPKRGNSPSKRKALVRNALNKFNTSSNSNNKSKSSAAGYTAGANSSVKSKVVGPISLEMEADNFFSSSEEEDGSNKHKSPLLFSLKETAAISNTDVTDMPLIRRLWHLCYRRAWSDVLQVSNELLTSSTSPYSNTYQHSLLTTASGPTLSKPQNNNHLMEQTCEILAWRWTAFGKLRRRHDLKRDIEKVQDAIMNCKNNDDHENPYIPPLIQIHLVQSLTYLTHHNDGNLHDDNNTKDEKSFAINDSGVCLNDLFYKLLEQQSQSNGSPYIVARLHLALIHSSLSTSFAYSHNNYRMALFHIKALLEHLQSHQMLFSNANANNTNNVNLWTLFQFEIYSLHGHILLQVGAIDEAAQILNQCSTLQNNNSLPQSYQTRIQVHNGLLQFANNNYTGAFQQFSQAIQNLQQEIDTVGTAIDEESKVVSPYIVSVQDNWCTLFPSLQQVMDNHNNDKNAAVDLLFSSACNNLALTALYTCRMTEAVQILEDLIRTDPTIFLTETVAFNLCTLYELGHDIKVSERKKQVLQLIAKRFYLHDLGNAESFRLS